MRLKPLVVWIKYMIIFFLIESNSLHIFFGEIFERQIRTHKNNI